MNYPNLRSEHNLPVHPAYAMLGSGRWPREHIRVGCIDDPEGAEMGLDADIAVDKNFSKKISTKY